MNTNFKLFYDALGQAFIIEGDYVINCVQNVRLKAYDIARLKNLSDDSVMFDLSKGHRYDYQSHNYILLYEYFSLSYSFMTFVFLQSMQIKENIEALDDDPKCFDEKQFSWIINRRTFFSCNNFVAENYDKLATILPSLYEKDKYLIEQLNYYYPEIKKNVKKKKKMSLRERVRYSFRRKSIEV